MSERRFEWPMRSSVAQAAAPDPGPSAEELAAQRAQEILETARRDSGALLEQSRQTFETARAERKRVLQHTRRRAAEYLRGVRRRAQVERARILQGLEDDAAICVRRAVELLLGHEPATSEEDMRGIVRRLLAEAGGDATAYVSPEYAGIEGCATDRGLDGVRVVRTDGAEWVSTAASRVAQVEMALGELGHEATRV